MEKKNIENKMNNDNLKKCISMTMNNEAEKLKNCNSRTVYIMRQNERHSVTCEEPQYSINYMGH